MSDARPAIQPDQVPPGTHQEFYLPIERLPSNTLIEMPVFVYRGREAGPTLLLTAALHGDEVIGTEALRRLSRLGDLQPGRGTVISIPIVNIYGFLHQSRTLPDGKDLNRSFPGSPGGSLARRLAGVVMTEVVPLCDAVVDLHTGGARRTNYPQVRCDFGRTDSLALGRAFGAPFLIHSTEIEGSFRKAVSNMDKPVIVYEGGESLRHDELATREAMQGIRRIMVHLGIKDNGPGSEESRVIESRKWLRAKQSGVFVPGITYGAEVIEGDVLAHLGDPYGKKTEELKAPFDGFVIGLNNATTVHAGDALIHLGKSGG